MLKVSLLFCLQVHGIRTFHVYFVDDVNVMSLVNGDVVVNDDINDFYNRYLLSTYPGTSNLVVHALDIYALFLLSRLYDINTMASLDSIFYFLLKPNFKPLTLEQLIRQAFPFNQDNAVLR